MLTFLGRVIDSFKHTATDQEMKGIQHYGQALDPMDDKWDWLKMAEEELVDAYKYLIAERERRDRILGPVLVDLQRAIDLSANGFTVTEELKTILEDLKRLTKTF